MDMKTIYYKTGIVLLIVACALLGVTLASVLMHFHGIGTRIDEKAGIIKENEANYQKTLESLSATMEEMDARFRVITENEVETERQTLKDMPVTKEDLLALEKVFDPRRKNIEGVLEAFEKFTADPGHAVNTLKVCGTPEALSDRDLSVLLELAKRAELDAFPKLFWDLKNGRFWTETVLTNPRKKGSFTVVSGRAGQKASAVMLDSGKTLIFPLEQTLLSSKERVIFEQMPLPIGSRFGHFFRVFCKEDFVLEYTGAEGQNLADLNLRAIPFDISTRIEMPPPAEHSLRLWIRPSEKEAVFLVTADRLFVPQKIALQLKSAKDLTLPAVPAGTSTAPAPVVPPSPESGK